MSSSTDTDPSGLAPYPGSSSQDMDTIDLVFACKIDKIQHIATMLGTVNFSKEKTPTIATVTINASGIKFTVEESHSLQANVFLKAELFQQFTLNRSGLAEGGIQFRISLSVFLDCLNIFGHNNNSPTSLQMLYSGHGNPLVLTLMEDKNTNAITDVTISTMESEGVINYNFRGSPVHNKLIMHSNCLKEAFNELDWSSTYVNIILSPDAPFFRLQTSGNLGSCQVDYPKTSDEVFESFECHQTQSNFYKLSVIQPTVKALAIASQTQVRVNERGVLSLQHFVDSKASGSHCFIDFLILPSEDSGESDEEM